MKRNDLTDEQEEVGGAVAKIQQIWKPHYEKLIGLLASLEAPEAEKFLGVLLSLGACQESERRESAARSIAKSFPKPGIAIDYVETSLDETRQKYQSGMRDEFEGLSQSLSPEENLSAVRAFKSAMSVWPSHVHFFQSIKAELKVQCDRLQNGSE